MIRKMVTLFGFCGFLIAVLLGSTCYYLLGHTSVNPNNAPLLSLATDWLWPTAIMLMAWHKQGAAGAALGIVFSAFANAAIYSLTGFIVGAIIKSLTSAFARSR